MYKFYLVEAVTDIDDDNGKYRGLAYKGVFSSKRAATMHFKHDIENGLRLVFTEQKIRKDDVYTLEETLPDLVFAAVIAALDNTYNRFGEDITQ